jgi:peptidoglycan pentaglycine glycine transferase (the first glycine)
MSGEQVQKQVSNPLECQPDEITIFCSETPADSNWDAFLAQIPGVHFEQTSMWALLRQSYGWKPIRWVAFQNGRILGGIQLLIRPIGRLGNVGYVIRGPMCKEGQPWLEGHLINQVTAYARQHRFIYQVFDVPYHSTTLPDILDRTGYIPHPPNIPPAGLITATLLLDLQPSLDDLLKHMRKDVRQNIRCAERSGLETLLGGEEDLDTFRELMLAVCRRRGSSPTPPQPDFFRRLWQAAGKSGFVKLFLVRFNGEIVSAALSFTIGDTIRNWKVGWSGAYPHKYPNHLLRWWIIKWAKENGFRQLDFVWVNDHDAKLLSRGEKKTEAFKDGTTFFKLGFGGHLLMLPCARSQSFHPVLRSIIHAGGMRLITSRASRFLLRNLWSSLGG